MIEYIYTGVGSRKTPPDILQQIFWQAFDLANANWILRSGGADGCDLAFEWGCNHAYGKKEIFLPYKGFNGSTSLLYDINPEAFYIASNIHPKWNELSDAAKKLHARNVHQVLGLDLKTPSDRLYCWTLNGESVGGTRTAIVLAKEYGVDIINYGKPFQKRRPRSLY